VGALPAAEVALIPFVAFCDAMLSLIDAKIWLAVVSEPSTMRPVPLLIKVVYLIMALAVPVPVGWIRIPAEVELLLLSVMTVFTTDSWLAALGAKWMPLPGEPPKPRIVHFSTCNAAPVLNLMPTRPE